MIPPRRGKGYAPTCERLGRCVLVIVHNHGEVCGVACTCIDCGAARPHG